MYRTIGASFSILFYHPFSREHSVIARLPLGSESSPQLKQTTQTALKAIIRVMLEILRYSLLKTAAVLLRLIVRFVAGSPKCSPDTVLYIASREPGRKIKLHLYNPIMAKAKGPGPVLVNLHGSGFILPAHGSDHDFCARLARETDYTILDVRYRLAPEHPFPSALHDVEDVVQWVLQQKQRFDSDRFAISGFSAGGNLALVTAGVVFPPETFRSVVAFYPSTDKSIDPRNRKMPDTAGRASPPILSRLFDACYIPPTVSRKSPLVSPSFAQADRFPQNILLVTGAQDNLCIEAEELVARIEAVDSSRHIVRRRMEKCGHAWDKTAAPDSIQEKAKLEAYALAVDLLQK
jgi:acetyl esterase/lipase